ncbi:MAG: helix-turn-helix domain-containing protein [Bacteroidales bacterium]|nr:helix-turn-helix domain-containing protein [Bacteroidales bacterium]MBO7322178.1 helix-turn-helix domain-containing protein [Bacteroidales bacterium]
MSDCVKTSISRCDMCGSDYPTSINVYRGKGIRIPSDNNHFNVLVFVLKGRVSVGDSIETKFIIDSGKFTLMDSSLLYFTTSDDDFVVTYHFNNILSNCTRTFSSRLLSFEGKDIDGDFPAVLEIKSQILNLITGVLDILKEKEVCSHYLNIKMEEMLISLTMFYPLEDLYAVFYRILSENPDFRTFVYSNFEHVNYSVEEFAKVANMSKVTFVRTFQKNFNQSPAVWLREKKCESIINDIVLTQIPFSELSYKYSFSSPAYFTLFCKKHWGKAPNELRKENLYRVRKV